MVEFESLVNEFSSKCDYIDCRVHELKKEVVMLENGETSNIFLDNKSFGVRVLINGGWGFAFSHDFTKSHEVFDKAVKLAKLSSISKIKFNPPPSINDDKRTKFIIDPFSINPLEKIELLKKYEALFNKDSAIKNTQLSLECSREDKTTYAPNINVHQEFTNNYLRINVTGRAGSVIQSFNERHTELGGYEFINKLSPEKIAGNVLIKINQLLKAKSPKPERATVVCDPQLAGLFLHEAIGHACEADLVMNNSSVLNGLRGKIIGSEEINLFNNPTINERGFYWYDDEGIKAHETPLITKGVLSGFMNSLKSANEMSDSFSGNGRAMNAELMPIPRMSNMVLKKGIHKVDDLIKEVGNGYLLKGFTGGQVDPISGQFCFGASEGLRIVNGEVGEHLRNVTLASSIFDSLKNIKVGDDYQPSMSGGTCGKNGQFVRVGEACPSILIKDVIIGGTA